MNQPVDQSEPSSISGAENDDQARRERLHDIDALRAFAMLLGLVLHAALAYVESGWPVQDSRQALGIGLVVAAIHGFRMPVFFLVSGYFTAMLWRRRGLDALLRQRFRRIVLPLLLGLLTVVPAISWISARAIESAAPRLAAVDIAEDPAAAMQAAVRAGDAAELKELLAAGADPDEAFETWPPPLVFAAAFGHVELCESLLDSGAKIDGRDDHGSTALHLAALFGRPEVARLLMARGADREARNKDRARPVDTLGADWKTTAYIAWILGVELNEDEVGRGRTAVAEALDAPIEVTSRPDESGLAELRETSFFHHLWFLWFLVWLVAIFALYAFAADRLGRWRVPANLVVSPLRYLWLLPLTALPQFLMGRDLPTFGADTSAGLVPVPAVFAYYAIFFFFGVLYREAHDRERELGRRWYLSLPLALVLLFPLGLVFVFGSEDLDPAMRPANRRLLAALLQASYAWLMTFGLIGLFRRLFRRERSWVRYVSDSSYWLYLVHLPLVIALQFWWRDWPAPAVLKWLLVSLTVTLVLLLLYARLVRYSWLGRLLNGPRNRPAS